MLKSQKLLNENINVLKETQREMENEFSQALNETGSKSDLKNATKNLKAATHALNRSFKQNPLGNDIFQKIEADRLFSESTIKISIENNIKFKKMKRLFLEGVLQNLIPEIGDNKFQSLKNTVMIEKNNKVEFQEIIRR